MKKSFLEFAKGGFVLLDGGFGTELQKAGLPGGVAPETLNTEAPEKVLAVFALGALISALAATFLQGPSAMYALILVGLALWAFRRRPPGD